MNMADFPVRQNWSALKLRTSSVEVARVGWVMSLALVVPATSWVRLRLVVLGRRLEDLRLVRRLVLGCLVRWLCWVWLGQAVVDTDDGSGVGLAGVRASSRLVRRCRPRMVRRWCWCVGRGGLVVRCRLVVRWCRTVVGSRFVGWCLVRSRLVVRQGWWLDCSRVDVSRIVVLGARFVCFDVGMEAGLIGVVLDRSVQTIGIDVRIAALLVAVTVLRLLLCLLVAVAVVRLEADRKRLRCWLVLMFR